MTSLKVMMGCAGIFSVLLVFATQRIPAPNEKIVVETPDDRFTRSWNDVMSVASASALKKADRERVAAADPKPVATERITTPDAPVTVPPAIAVQEDKPARRSRRYATVETNVCTRHHLRRVTTRGGRSWRCKR
jgi:hypothetical protein